MASDVTILDSLSQVLVDPSVSETLHYLVIVNYACVGSLAALVYEYFITLPDEISLVWSSPWSITKVFYLCNRYSPFVDVPLAARINLGIPGGETCKKTFQAFGYMYAFGVIAAEGIPTIRTYAIWKCNKWVLCILAVVGLGVYVWSVVMLYTVYLTYTYPVLTLPNKSFCTPFIEDQDVWSGFVLNMVHELVIVSLTLLQRYICPARAQGLSPLVKVLYRDGIVFYLAMLTMSALNLTMMFATPRALSPALQIPLRVIHSMMSSRVLLNLRKVARVEEPDSLHLSDIDFQIPDYLR